MHANNRCARCHTPQTTRVALILLFIGTALAACAPAVTPRPAATRVPAVAATVAVQPTATTTSLSTQDQIGIYAAVLRQLYGPDDTFGGTLQAPTAYVLRQPNSAAPGAPAGGALPPVLPEAIQVGVTAALADLPTQLVWVDAFADVPRDGQTGAVLGNGAVFSVGGIDPQPDGTVQVAGSIYIASLAAGGTTYVVAKQGAAWVVTGNTGSQSIS